MKVLDRYIAFIIKGGFYQRSILLGVLFLLFIGKAVSQNACPPNVPPIDSLVKCPTENEYEIMGIPTVTTGSTYTWYKNGARLAGPLPGDGTPTSFGFSVRTSSDAGHYTVEENLPNGSKICRFNQVVQVTALPVAQTLTGGGPLCPGPIRTLTITATQPNVTYGLLKDGGLWESQHSTGTGPLNFDVYIPDLYTVQANKDSCTGVYRFFGNAVITAVPDRSVVNFTTTTSANVSWSGSGNFLVEYGNIGFTPGTGAGVGGGIMVINASSSPVTINGLSPGVLYDVYVRQLCQGATYVSSEVAHFKTDCTPVGTFPWVEGFEGAVPPNLPVCWNELDLNAGFDWTTTTFQPRAGGLRSLQGGASDYVVLPRINLSGNKRLKFWVKPSQFAPYHYQVRLSTTDNARASFSTILLNDTSRSNIYEEKIIDLSAYPGNVYIALFPAFLMKFDDFTIENIPVCPGPSFVKVINASNTSATVKWTGTGTFIAEYGPPGFTPGTGLTPGTNGIVITSATSPLTISSLTASTSYDVYIRQNCSGNGFSANSPKVNFTTFITCSPTVVNTCTNVITNMPSGSGVADFWGLYPVNSTGKATPGRELLYSFTPSTTGVYYLDMTAVSSELCYFYKLAGCGNGGWSGIANVNAIGKYPVGLLQSGTPYYILVDNPNTVATTHNFKICRANVVAPVFNNFCLTTNTIPYVSANSPKPEYLIDGAGNLIAGLNFSGVSNELTNVTGSYWVNDGPVRHDTAKKEYLDRSFTITTPETPANPVAVTLYFTDADLLRLINEPNDGDADVASVTDLKVTRGQTSCSGYSGANTSFINPTGNGNYDAGSKYVQFNTPGFSTFYLHGGSDALFNADIICPGDNTTMSITPPADGYFYIYQWQVDMGSGFVNIIPNDYYTGINTPTLGLKSPPTSYYGYKYRCIATGVNTVNTVTSDYKILKFSMTWTGSESVTWEDPRNWSCDFFGKNAIPDANVDVIIPNVTPKPEISSNVSCRSVKIETGATLKVNTGFRLDITGH